ncbi:hypothetical protein AXW67_17610 [Bradyrhizobium neotropicale]|uniref:Uncharacterized protein n=1 Tax=Bradyrhizobium neotropicale TaxID=1497615 RepID=A0A176Z2L0_9BRAD|nr:hypothetical protein AXW67_17610 [Bradyrhizobium neotropicale]
MQQCTCCAAPGQFSILVAAGPGEPPLDPRYYLPNQMVRSMANDLGEQIKELWFCKSCIRKVEDNFRATILSLRAGNNLG